MLIRSGWPPRLILANGLPSGRLCRPFSCSPAGLVRSFLYRNFHCAQVESSYSRTRAPLAHFLPFKGGFGRPFFMGLLQGAIEQQSAPCHAIANEWTADQDYQKARAAPQDRSSLALPLSSLGLAGGRRCCQPRRRVLGLSRNTSHRTKASAGPMRQNATKPLPARHSVVDWQPGPCARRRRRG
jgi:hypothetical protein